MCCLSQRKLLAVRSEQNEIARLASLLADAQSKLVVHFAFTVVPAAIAMHGKLGTLAFDPLDERPRVFLAVSDVADANDKRVPIQSGRLIFDRWKAAHHDGERVAVGQGLVRIVGRAVARGDEEQGE